MRTIKRVKTSSNEATDVSLFYRIPPEIISLILDYLNPLSDYARVALVCKKFAVCVRHKFGTLKFLNAEDWDRNVEIHVDKQTNFHYIRTMHTKCPNIEVFHMPFQLNADIQWPLIMASGFAKLKSLPVAQAKIWRTDGDVPEHVAAAFTSLCIISTYSEPFDDICNYIGVLENTTEQLKSLELNANTTFNGNKTEISMDGRGLRDLCIRLVASQQDFTNPMPFKLAFKHSDDSLKKLQSLNVESNHDFCMAGLTNTLVNAHDHLLSLRMLGGTTKTLRPNMHFPHLMKLNLAFPLADATIENMPPNDALIRNITKFVGNNSRVLSRLALAGRIMFEDMELQVDDIPNWIDLWLNAIEMH